MTLASCSENTWNDHFLDGFEGGVNYDKAVTGSYTLTADDYETISELMEGMASTDAEKAEAKAIATNRYFNKFGAFPASVALPKFFETSSFPYYLASNGSLADVAYAEAAEVPEEIGALAAAFSYEISSEDYQNAWGSDEDYIDAFAPMTSAEAKIPGILKKAIPDAETGSYAVVSYNESASNPIFGSVSGDAPVFEAGNYYMIADGNMGAAPLADKSYGYLPVVEMTIENGVVSPAPENIFSFEATDGGFFIKDSLGRYLYQSGKYDSFNFSYTVPEDGAVWTVALASNGLATITNTSVGKWIQYSSNYSSWGSYDSEKGSLPKLYAASSPAKVVVGTPVSESLNAVYFYNGSRWSVADGVSVLNPSDYKAMGASENNLKNPADLIPIYLKNTLPYAMEGDERYVVYNGTTADLFVYDGAEWTLNNNGLENVVGRFTKSNDSWSFTKYIGKTTFSLFNEDQLILDRSYLLAYGNVCATPIETGSDYGYLTVAGIEAIDGSIVLPSDANAFTFATKATVEDKEYTAPEGKFFIIDSNNRFNYYDGSHASMQVKDAPILSDGEVAQGFCWSATRNSDGSWLFESDYGDGNVRWLVYSTKYNNFAIYSTITETDFSPVLYLMEE